MAKIIPFPQINKQTNDMVDKIILSQLSHKHPEIQKCLKSELAALVNKYFNGEDLAYSVVLPRDLNDEQFTMIEAAIKNTIVEHSRQINYRANQLFIDLCLSRMALCELRHQLQEN